MKRLFAMLAVCVVVVAVAGGRSQAGEVLGGLPGLACEARLCLSTGAAPGECSPALSHYYSIHGATPAETEALRQAFLNMCPVVGRGPVAPTWETRGNELVQVSGSGRQVVAVDNDGYLVSLGYEDVSDPGLIASCGACEEE